MKKLLTTYILLFLLGSISLYSQTKYQKNILHFDIIEADNNGINNSEFYIQKGAYVTFYKIIGDTSMHMAVVFPADSTWSNGQVIVHPITISNELYLGYPTKKTFYQWYFHNSYNAIKGWANVELSMVQHDIEPYCILKIITHDDFQILTYKGHFNVEESGKEVELKQH